MPTSLPRDQWGVKAVGLTGNGQEGTTISSDEVVDLAWPIQPGHCCDLIFNKYPDQNRTNVACVMHIPAYCYTYFHIAIVQIPGPDPDDYKPKLCT